MQPLSMLLLFPVYYKGKHIIPVTNCCCILCLFSVYFLLLFFCPGYATVDWMMKVFCLWQFCSNIPKWLVPVPNCQLMLLLLWKH